MKTSQASHKISPGTLSYFTEQYRKKGEFVKCDFSFFCLFVFHFVWRQTFGVHKHFHILLHREHYSRIKEFSPIITFQ